MDVQADEARLMPDPSATAVVERPVTDSQGQLFRDAYPTYADTDKIPAVNRGRRHPSRAARWLRVLVVLVARSRDRRRGGARAGEGRRHRQERDQQPDRDEDDAPSRCAQHRRHRW